MVDIGNFQELRKKNIKVAKEKVKNSVSKDLMIINAINNIEELDKTINVFSGRLREWHALTDPEMCKRVEDNEVFITEVLQAVGGGSEMGAKLDEDDETAIKALAATANALIQTKTFLLLYLEKTMDLYCKNVLVLAGPTIGAKLLREAGSLKRLASLQSSTVQLLGAEKALFRHIKTGARSPKYGHIINHQIIASAAHADKGKAARSLADKLSMAARVDYFKGEFIADKFLKELTEKFCKKEKK